MSSDAPEPESPAGTDDEESAPALLFGQWEVTDIEYYDPSTERYITVTPIAHTMGRHAGKQFKKSEISIVERLINRLMQTDENTGKKQQATRIAREAFDIVHNRTEENPVQVLVQAVENSAPREETVRLKYGGISVPKAVDVAPQRRV
ncbi:30S ribosomal protein S7, partial [Halorientalis sp.]|uniref:30S ribosomal protein S7 n=1 Tax=Halorientalis sp. TaxID=1931229 RepID=UPI0032C216B8